MADKLIISDGSDNVVCEGSGTGDGYGKGT
jgi:hypothetical protein